MKKTIVLCIMDGYGLATADSSNAISQAKTPNIDYLFKNYPHTALEASGMPVGLPAGQMGNSEVGHLNIGAGRIVYQALTLISQKIRTGEFFHNKQLLAAIEHVKKNNSKLHLFGLLSDGGVHSHIEHIKATIKMAKANGLKDIYIHAFLDGRDVEPTSGLIYLKDLLAYCKELSFGQIVTISGRYYAMDRDKNLDRVDRAYVNMVNNQGHKFTDPIEYVKNQHQNGHLDEFVEPGYNEKLAVKISDHDSIIFANYRPDRAIQISTILTNPNFYSNYQPSIVLKDIFLVQMMKYADSVKGPIAFSIPELKNILGEVLADGGFTQLRIAETEKYAHVTFFFDGSVNYDGITQPALKNCDRILIDSPKVATYDLMPEMSIKTVCSKAVDAIASHKYDVIILNFANCDMVGHTAVKEAVIKAVEYVDESVGKIYQAVKENNGLLLLTADHGNADKITDEIGRPFTAHTNNPVPFIITDKQYKLNKEGKLADIAPTILELLKVKIPAEMVDGEGKSLLIKSA